MDQDLRLNNIFEMIDVGFWLYETTPSWLGLASSTQKCRVVDAEHSPVGNLIWHGQGLDGS